MSRHQDNYVRVPREALLAVLGNPTERFLECARTGNVSGLELLLVVMKDNVDHRYMILRDRLTAKYLHDRTALMEAVWHGQPECAKLLIAAGADVNARDKGENTPLFDAVTNDGRRTTREGRNACTALLIEAGADFNARDKDGFTVLSRAKASGKGYLESVWLLKKAGAIDTLDPERSAICAPAGVRSNHGPTYS